MRDIIVKYCESVAVSGREDRRICEIERKMLSLGFVCTRDGFGNLTVSNGDLSTVKTAIIVPVDTGGYYITSIENDGRLRIGAGGNMPKDISGATLISEGGIKGTVSDKAEKVIDCTVDIGAKSRAEAEKSVKIGDTLSFYSPICASEDKLFGAHLSVGVPLALMLCGIEKHGLLPEVCVIFATQSAVGMRGARCAGYLVNADHTVLLGSVEEKHAPMGEGAVIVARDAEIISDFLLVKRTRDTALSEKIRARIAATDEQSPFQNILAIGKEGSRLLKIAIPVKTEKNHSQTVNIKDIEECERLTELLLRGGISFERKDT